MNVDFIQLMPELVMVQMVKEMLFIIKVLFRFLLNR